MTSKTIFVEMKKLPLILSIVAVVATVVLYIIVLCGKGGKAESVSMVSEDGKVISTSIVYVNVDSLIRSYDMYYDLQKEFETKAKKKDADFTSRTKKLEREVRDFQEKIEKGLVTRSQAQQMQEGLAQKEQELLQLRQQLQAELAEEEAVMLRNIQDNIQKYILEYNASKNYTLILSNTAGSVLLYGDPGLNVTAEVLEGLNASYVKNRKK